MSISSRNNIIKKYTSRDYIQNGLIFQFDGIENSGYNNHETDITEWKDLISGTALPISETDEKSNVYHGNAGHSVNLKYDGDMTFGGRFLYSDPDKAAWEYWAYIGIGRDSGIANGIRFSGLSPSGSKKLTCEYQTKYATPYYYSEIVYQDSQYGKVYSCYVVFHYLSKSFDFYVDGKLIGSAVIQPDQWNLENMNVKLQYGYSYGANIPERRYNALVYNRALEPWEIQHNYDIDLKRFPI